MINTQNVDDNECFKWCLLRYIHPADHHPARITKVKKDFLRYLEFTDITFPVKIRDIHKIEEKNSIGISVFFMKIRKNIESVYQKNIAKKHVHLLLMGEEGKRNYVLIKDFSTFMYYDSLH